LPRVGPYDREETKIPSRLVTSDRDRPSTGRHVVEGHALRMLFSAPRRANEVRYALAPTRHFLRIQGLRGARCKPGFQQKGGYLDSAPLEITHQRASYEVVFVDRQQIFLKSRNPACPFGPGLYERRLVKPPIAHQSYPSPLVSRRAAMSGNSALSTKS
jgi:hypothetical protein